MNKIIRKLEKIRIINCNEKRKKYIEHSNIITGKYIII